MAVKTKVITNNNEVDDFLKELLGKLHYIAQSADNILIKKFFLILVINYLTIHLIK